MRKAVLEDMTGSIECWSSPTLTSGWRSDLKLESPGAGAGRCARRRRRQSQAHGQRPHVRWKRPSPSCPVRCASECRWRSSSDATIDALHVLLSQRKGEAKVLFDVERAGDFMVVMEAEGYNVMPDRAFITRVEELCGRGAVRVIN